MDLCLEAERLTGERVTKKWWEQHSLRLTGVRGDGDRGTETEGTEESEGTGD